LQKFTNFHAIRSWSFQNICNEIGWPRFCATLYNVIRAITTLHPNQLYPTTSSLHNLLPAPREHPSITQLRVPSEFPRIPVPTRTKKYQSFFSHALTHYQTSLLCFSTVFIVFCVCFCIFFQQLFSLWLLLSINDIYTREIRKIRPNQIQLTLTRPMDGPNTWSITHYRNFHFNLVQLQLTFFLFSFSLAKNHPFSLSLFLPKK